MRLQYVFDASAAEWLARAATPFDQLVCFGPDTFTAYARLRFIPDPVRPGQAEADVVLLEDHPSDLEQARRALARLRNQTTSADHCYFCIWEGDGSTQLPAGRPDRSAVDLVHRRYALLEGPLDAVQQWERDLGGGQPVPPPAFIWPADHSWCFASDVDPHWAGIGASAAAIASLLADPALDVVSADPARPQPHY